MPTQVSESFILRSYPFREGDLIISFFTREEGKLRGVARRARRPKSPFGAGLERLSHVRLAYFLKENAELASLSSCELMESGFGVQPGYECSLALDYITEMSEHLLPPHEANEKFFRLLKTTIEHLRAGGSIWPAIDYFTLWAMRLTGVGPELQVSEETAELVNRMFVTPLAGVATPEWNKTTLQALRRRLVRAVEQHVERRMLTVPLLEAL